MKTILSIILLIITLNCNAQFSQKLQLKDSNVMLVPIGLVVTTALTVDLMSRSSNENLSNVQTLDIVGLTGITISVMSYIVIDKIKNNPPKKVYKKRIKRLNHL